MHRTAPATTTRFKRSDQDYNAVSISNTAVEVSSIKTFFLLRANRKQARPRHLWIYACIVYGYMQVNVMPMQENKEPPYYVQNHATKEAYMWYTGPCINGVRIHVYVTVCSTAWIDRFPCLSTSSKTQHLLRSRQGHMSIQRYSVQV